MIYTKESFAEKVWFALTPANHPRKEGIAVLHMKDINTYRTPVAHITLFDADALAKYMDNPFMAINTITVVSNLDLDKVTLPVKTKTVDSTLKHYGFIEYTESIPMTNVFSRMPQFDDIFASEQFEQPIKSREYKFSTLSTMILTNSKPITKDIWHRNSIFDDMLDKAIDTPLVVIQNMVNGTRFSSDLDIDYELHYDLGGSRGLAYRVLLQLSSSNIVVFDVYIGEDDNVGYENLYFKTNIEGYHETEAQMLKVLQAFVLRRLIKMEIPTSKIRPYGGDIYGDDYLRVSETNTMTSDFMFEWYAKKLKDNGFDVGSLFNGMKFSHD